MRMVDKARRRENEKKGRRERKREGGGGRTKEEGEHQSSARQNVSLLYERNGRRNSPTKRPASDDVVLTTPSFAHTYSLFALLARHSRAQDAYIVRSRLCPPLHSGGLPRWRRGDPGEEGIDIIVKRSIITGSLRVSFLLALYAFLFLIRHIVIVIKINSCSRVTERHAKETVS